VSIYMPYKSVVYMCFGRNRYRCNYPCTK